jgi:hypothetical protein
MIATAISKMAALNRINPRRGWRRERPLPKSAARLRSTASVVSYITANIRVGRLCCTYAVRHTR